ncbi:hypothetical protein KY328_05200 [Candidatus Woesearchaeota archaeon]|nr:hypothetical protein [Candidatus Woesearchaeota archaeon]MBW3022294.1 hypothetical protein [Candidatus Woesearchaeota archaeon]
MIDIILSRDKFPIDPNLKDEEKIIAIRESIQKTVTFSKLKAEKHGDKIKPSFYISLATIVVGGLASRAFPEYTEYFSAPGLFFFLKTIYHYLCHSMYEGNASSYSNLLTQIDEKINRHLPNL